MSEGPAPERHIAVFLTGANAETLERVADDAPDRDGHVVSAAVMNALGPGSIPPVRVAVAHGCAPETAAAMLRKMALLIEAAPEMLRAGPGWAYRRLSDGTVSRKHVTIEGLRAAASEMPDELRAWLEGVLTRIEPAIRDDEPPLGGAEANDPAP